MSFYNLSTFKTEIAQFSPGKWLIGYHDSTHLRQDEIVRLGLVTVEACTPAPDNQVYFSFRSLIDSKSTDPNIVEIAKQYGFKPMDEVLDQQYRSAATKVVTDQLSASLVRLGIIQPSLDMPEEFEERKFVTLVVDTNAIRVGSLRHIKERHGRKSISVIIPLVSIMELAERVANLTSVQRDGCKPKNYQFIRHRPQGTVIPQEILWIKSEFPTEILEMPPELLRAFHGFEPKKIDNPEQFTMNDRLILEGIKDIRRQRGIANNIFLVTGDKDMARLAHLEEIATIFPSLPDLSTIDGAINSARYSMTAQRLVVCSLHRLLWDLTHVFSRIYAKCISGQDQGKELELFYYFQGKLINDWAKDMVEVIQSGPGSTANPV